MIEPRGQNILDIDVGSRHIIIQQRYEALGALNDLLIAVWFLIGSFFFLNNALVESSTWLFIVGSFQLLLKPLIKLTGLIHVQKLRRKEVSH
ncbi:MAG: hypothetical protein CR991_01330 [Proteobacteria bacterium]|nr:MAG: hypothetical protein CR991_01330 [Pseudomonadota bacterium]